MAKIDPAFQAAPFYGQSSYDPIEAVKNAKEMRYKQALIQRKEADVNMEKGLKNLAMEIKGWDDQKGFEEISGELEDLRSRYVELGSKGLNLYNPKSFAEQRLAREFNTRVSKLQQKHDVWQQAKEKVETARQIIEKQLQMPEEERTIDVELQKQAIEDYKNTEGGILDRNAKLDSLIKTKARPIDIGVWFAGQYKQLISGLDKHPEAINTDPVTGRTTIKTVEGVDEKRIEEATRKIARNIKSLPRNMQAAIEREYKDDEDNVKTKEEWIRERFLPAYPTKKETRISGGRSGGAGLGINFLGRKTTMEPGMLRRDPIPYGDRTYQSPYEFTSKDAFTIPIGTRGSSYFFGNSWQPIEGGGDIEGNLRFYDSNRDEFVFRTTQTGFAPFTQNNMTIAVPRRNLGDRADELPIEVDGVIKQFKDVFGPSDKSVKTIGGKDYRVTPVKNKTVGGKDYGMTPYIPKNK